MLKYKKFIISGFLAGLALLGVYFLVLAIAGSFSHAYSQFLEMWYLVLILAAGFGAQFGLFIYIKEKQKVSPGKVLAASGGVSTGSMIACCLHHLTDVLPLMGLAAAAVFLTKYQLFFVILGILSNLVGIAMMLHIIKNNQLTLKFKKAAIGLSLIALSVSFLLAANGWINNSEEKTNPAVNFLSQTDSQGGISFEALPVDFSFENPVKFEIKIDTHSGSLDFDLTKISILEDDLGNKYQPLEWQGAGPGGHHREGILSFPKLENKLKSIKLIVEDIAGQLRIFEWNLK